MQEVPSDSCSAGVPFQDAIIAIYKHKWKILAFALLGLAAAAAVFFVDVPVYESQAKLLVRYVVDRSAVDPESVEAAGAAGRYGDNVINSEVEILTSWDLVAQVASSVKPPITADKVKRGLVVTARKGNVLFASFKSRDQQGATVVLNELIKRYFEKHLEIHRSAEALKFVEDQTEQVRTQLSNTESDLKRQKANAGIVSLVEGGAALNTELSRTQEQLHTAEAEVAEQLARVNEIERSLGVKQTSVNVAAARPAAEAAAGNPPGPGSTPESAGATQPEASSKATGLLVGGTVPGSDAAAPPREVDKTPAANSGLQAGTAEIQRYEALSARLAHLRREELERLSKYTPGSELVRQIQTQIETVGQQQRNLERQFPDLIAKVPAPNSPAPARQADLPAERARLAGSLARAETLKSQLARLRERLTKFAESAPMISALERQRDLQEANYKYFGASLEKARIDGALARDSSQMPNISVVQAATPAARVTSARNKIALGFAGGGLGFGLALAMFLELVLNRTVKQPLELETRLRIPLLLSIPFMGQKQRLQLRGPGPAPKSAEILAATPWERGHFLRSYFEAIRDRLSLYFEISEIKHKPKLVGVTSFADGAGASTLAGGLAASLSEIGDGKVLLVDMNVGNGRVHPFFKGTPAYSLTAALQAPEIMDSATENLYLATVSPANERAVPIGLKKFFDLMPGLKASDFDYIIFDMPPLGQTSPTQGMAGFMDKLLVVVEAEKTSRDVVKRGYGELVARRANVSVVFNKARSHGPRWLESEMV